jgi:hypothetical protein
MIRPLLLFTAIALSVTRAETAPNTLSAEETHAGWRLLWDGKTSAGWRNSYGESFPTELWEMNDGVFSIRGTGKPGTSGGDIITAESFSNFELSVDFKITPGANSGIKYFVDAEVNAGREGAQLGLEYQIIDDRLHPDAKLGKNGDRTMGSLYDIIPPVATKRSKPIGEWNTGRIVVRGAHVEHWLNGEKVLECTRFTPDFRQAVKDSKYKKWPKFGELSSGHILLQEHGGTVSFRNLKIRSLPNS